MVFLGSILEKSLFNLEVMEYMPHGKRLVMRGPF